MPDSAVFAASPRHPHNKPTTLTTVLAFFVAVFSIAAAGGCLHQLDEPMPVTDDSGALDTALVNGTGGLSFVSVSHEGTYENPVLLAVSAPPGVVAEVAYDADGWPLGAAEDPLGGYAVVYRFQQTGVRVVRARAFDAQQQLVGEVVARIRVLDRSTTEVAFVSPAQEGGTYLNGVWIKVAVEGAPATAVRYSVDQWEIGRSDNAADDFAIRYTFSELGTRTIRAEVLDSGDQVIATANRTIVVTGPISGIKYFYQYANALSPGATCQNTSIAMVLSSIGGVACPTTSRRPTVASERRRRADWQACSTSSLRRPALPSGSHR